LPEPLKIVRGKAAPLEADDVDTDQIIPAQFLKVTEKLGIGRYLFYRWRYDSDGVLTRKFVLDRAEFKGSAILVAGRNFGIGSSRENAVWALLDMGVRCVVASSFGDIFYNNASKNGLLCVRLPESTVADFRSAAASADLLATVDVERQTLSFADVSAPFELAPHIKSRLLSGADEIAITLTEYEGGLKRYERAAPAYLLPRRPNAS
jgi:3-isopropylmalate/(R)-2-methylmalate dehydratase small subunit